MARSVNLVVSTIIIVGKIFFKYSSHTHIPGNISIAQGFCETEKKLRKSCAARAVKAAKNNSNLIYIL